LEERADKVLLDDDDDDGGGDGDGDAAWKEMELVASLEDAADDADDDAAAARGLE